MGGLLMNVKIETQRKRHVSQIHFCPNKHQAFVHASFNCGFESLPLGAYLAAAENDKCSKSISCNHNCDLPASVLQERL